MAYNLDKRYEPLIGSLVIICIHGFLKSFFFVIVNLRWHLLIPSQQILVVQKIHFKSFYIKTFKIKICIWRSRHCAPTAVNNIIRQHTISYKSPNEKNTTSSMKKSCTPEKKLNLNLIYRLDSITNLQK